VPNLELPALVGCDVASGFVAVDELQRTSVSDVYCAGEPTGIGGLELSLVEGQIAGYAAAEEVALAQPLFAARMRAARFARLVSKTFAPRNGLRRLCRAETIVCRCEDVRFAALTEHADARSAKLQTRCGMGACQGRICGAANRFLFGWHDESVRPPIVPVPLMHFAETIAPELSAQQKTLGGGA
jgi:NADPH-dependent 2,4-dienoyl-CoA reductase/sulfur reductase-like enzyme